MDLIVWLIIGAAAGWLASIIMGTDAEQGSIMNIVLGVIGSIVGGFVMNLFGAPGATGFNIWSLVVATLGAVLLIWVGKAMSHRTI